MFHYDAIGYETKCQFKAISPRGIQLFHTYGCSTPIITCGWSGKENNFDKLGGDVLGEVLEAIAQPFRIPQLPATQFLLDWTLFTGVIFGFF